MKLLTKELEKQFPGHKETEEIPIPEKIVIAKYFHPMSNWTWYAVEYDPVDRIFFGLVDGFEKEWGYFSLTELEETVVHGLGIERDLYFGQPKFKDIPELRDHIHRMMQIKKGDIK